MGFEMSVCDGEKLECLANLRGTRGRAVVIGAAPVIRGAELIVPGDFVAVCDGGLKYAIDAAIPFGLLVGDFDSYCGELPELAEGTELIRLPAEKDDTDIGFAVKVLLERGFRDFLILGGVGGRLDHTMGNISVAAEVAACGGVCRLTGDAEGEMLLVFRDRTVQLSPRKGSFVSIFPWGCECAVVTASGFKYPLLHGEVSARTTLGVSNEFSACFFDGSDVGPMPFITAESGTVVVLIN